MSKLLFRLPWLFEIMPYFGTFDEWTKLYIQLSKSTNELWRKNLKNIQRFPIKKKLAKISNKIDSSFMYVCKNLKRIYEYNKLPCLEWRTESEYQCLVEILKNASSPDIIEFSCLKLYLDTSANFNPCIEELPNTIELNLLSNYRWLMNMLTSKQIESVISYHCPTQPIEKDFPYVPYSHLYLELLAISIDLRLCFAYKK